MKYRKLGNTEMKVSEIGLRLYGNEPCLWFSTR